MFGQEGLHDLQWLFISLASSICMFSKTFESSDLVASSENMYKPVVLSVLRIPSEMAESAPFCSAPIVHKQGKLVDKLRFVFFCIN